MTTPHTVHQRPRTSLYLARHTSACPRARHWAATTLTHWKATGEETNTILLVMSELVTNAITHATGPIRAHLSRDTAGRYHVQVDDGGPAHQRPQHDDEHGRGLVLIDHLADHHGHGRAPYPYRSRAWAVLAPAPHSSAEPTVPAARTLEPAS
ncbi:ATP-binding protein [Streptomyces sp. NPDC053720]|uniref:ATP-binding protein n=1 Tax=Streptomyces sp. NPDC053720 TaxID=3154855 RepID=UPI00343134F7